MSANKLSEKILDEMKKYPKFYQKVWLACAKIPKGKVKTYGEIAKTIGSPKAARAVGQALAKNPFAPYVPCHRVVGSTGKMVGFSAPGGIKTKLEMLKKEKAIKWF
jgi:methylated-DNA-[protein]-cysteine S-methyltransferase